MNFELLARDGRARRGRLGLVRGAVETPAFMPVGTYGTVKAMTPEELKGLGAQIVLGNTFHLMLRPGPEVIAAHGGLHRFMNWPGPILTDSGGFQVWSLAELRKLTEEGVRFRSPVNGDPVLLTPESSIAVQTALDADIVMVFDECTPYPASEPVARNSMELSARWAARSRVEFDRLGNANALFGIVQGGLDPELRGASTRFIAALPCDGICIGGLAGDETPEQRDAALDVAVPLLADDPRPRYLMGLGSPADLLEAVHRGVDLFDSVLPARVARNGQLWIPGGRLNLRNRAFLDDAAPVQEDCPCLLCRRYSRAYLAHLFRAKELLAYRLATCHNLTFTLDFMARIRASIRAGTFPADMTDLRSRAGRVSGGEVAEQSA